MYSPASSLATHTEVFSVAGFPPRMSAMSSTSGAACQALSSSLPSMVGGDGTRDIRT